MQITINIPDAQMPRVIAYVESKFLNEDENGNPVPPPTNAELLAEFKRIIRQYIKGEVQQYELLKEHEALFAAYNPIEPTD